MKTLFKEDGDKESTQSMGVCAVPISTTTLAFFLLKDSRFNNFLIRAYTTKKAKPIMLLKV